jgi:hypothetical protein
MPDRCRRAVKAGPGASQRGGRVAVQSAGISPNEQSPDSELARRSADLLIRTQDREIRVLVLR